MVTGKQLILDAWGRAGGGVKYIPNCLVPSLLTPTNKSYFPVKEKREKKKQVLELGARYDPSKSQETSKRKTKTQRVSIFRHLVQDSLGYFFGAVCLPSTSVFTSHASCGGNFLIEISQRVPKPSNLGSKWLIQDSCEGCSIYERVWGWEASTGKIHREGAMTTTGKKSPGPFFMVTQGSLWPLLRTYGPLPEKSLGSHLTPHPKLEAETMSFSFSNCLA